MLQRNEVAEPLIGTEPGLTHPDHVSSTFLSVISLDWLKVKICADRLSSSESSGLQAAMAVVLGFLRSCKSAQSEKLNIGSHEVIQGCRLEHIDQLPC